MKTQWCRGAVGRRTWCSASFGFSSFLFPLISTFVPRHCYKSGLQPSSGLQWVSLPEVMTLTTPLLLLLTGAADPPHRTDRTSSPWHVCLCMWPLTSHSSSPSPPSLPGMWRPAAQSHVALWEDDRVRPAGRQPAEVQQLRLLVWLRWTGDSSGRLGPVGVSVGGALEVRGRSLTDGDFLHRCCKLHDHCYEASRKIPGCSGVADLPYVIDYDFTCSNRQVACSGKTEELTFFSIYANSYFRQFFFPDSGLSGLGLLWPLNSDLWSSLDY